MTSKAAQQLLQRQTNMALENVNQSQREVERLVSATPTGPTRNALADANIHLLESGRKLRAALALMEP